MVLEWISPIDLMLERHEDVILLKYLLFLGGERSIEAQLRSEQVPLETA